MIFVNIHKGSTTVDNWQLQALRLITPSQKILMSNECSSIPDIILHKGLPNLGFSVIFLIPLLGIVAIECNNPILKFWNPTLYHSTIPHIFILRKSYFVQVQTTCTCGSEFISGSDIPEQQERLNSSKSPTQHKLLKISNNSQINQIMILLWTPYKIWNR